MDWLARTGVDGDFASVSMDLKGPDLLVLSVVSEIEGCFFAELHRLTSVHYCYAGGFIKALKKSENPKS